MSEGTVSGSDDDRESRELARMISELNEDRMRLDAVVRKLADSTRTALGEGESVDHVEGLRISLATQLDRIRQKLVSRIPEQT